MGLQLLLHRRAGILVKGRLHQVRQHLDDVHLNTALADFVGKFHPNETATNNSQFFDLRDESAEEPVQIIVVFVDAEDAFQMGARNGGG